MPTKDGRPFTNKSKLQPCPYCNRNIRARGMSNHVRYIHQFPAVIAKLQAASGKLDDVLWYARNGKGHTSHTRDNTSSSHTSEELSPMAVMTQSSQLVTKDLSKCVRPDGRHFYTERDVDLFLAKLICFAWEHDDDNPDALLRSIGYANGRNRIIKDFEKRFKCKFEDVQSAYPNKGPGKVSESEALAWYLKCLPLKYDSYSR